MARPKSPDGRRVTVAARLSEPEAAEVDAVLGGLTRSEWLRMAALTVARGELGTWRAGTGPAADTTPVTVNRNAADTATERRERLPVNTNPVPVNVNTAEDTGPLPCRGGRHPSGLIDELGICRQCMTEVD